MIKHATWGLISFIIANTFLQLCLLFINWEFIPIWDWVWHERAMYLIIMLPMTAVLMILRNVIDE